VVLSPPKLSIVPTDEVLAPLLDIIGNKQAMAINQAGRGVVSDCHFRKTGTEYDGKPGIKWLSCTEK
jgi:hypothetical protein